MNERNDSRDERLIPPGVNDDRARAFMALIARLADESPANDLILSVIDDVDASLLPALVRGLSCEEFVQPGMPDRIVRTILKNAIPLHAAKGCDNGVLLGLSLLEFRASIIQWWASEPKGPANTHAIDVFADKGWIGGQDVTDPALQRAARRMVRGMKRQSQAHSLRFVVGSRGFVRVGAFASSHDRFATVPPTPSERTGRAPLRLAAAAAATELHCTLPLITGDQTRRSMLALGVAAGLAEIHATRPYRRAA